MGIFVCVCAIVTLANVCFVKDVEDCHLQAMRVCFALFCTSLEHAMVLCCVVGPPDGTPSQSRQQNPRVYHS